MHDEVKVLSLGQLNFARAGFGGRVVCRPLMKNTSPANRQLGGHPVTLVRGMLKRPGNIEGP